MLQWNFATRVIVHKIVDSAKKPKRSHPPEPNRWGIPPVMAFLWQDNNTVHLLSTVHDLGKSTSLVEKLR